MKLDIVEAWMWRSPEEIIERLIARNGAGQLRLVSHDVPRETKRGVDAGEASAPKDRYYTMARRVHIRALLRGKL